MRGLFSIITCSLILTACNYNDIKDPNAFGRSSNDKMTSPVSGQTTLSWNLIKTNVLEGDHLELNNLVKFYMPL